MKVPKAMCPIVLVSESRIGWLQVSQVRTLRSRLRLLICGRISVRISSFSASVGSSVVNKLFIVDVVVGWVLFL